MISAPSRCVTDACCATCVTCAKSPNLKQPRVAWPLLRTKKITLTIMSVRGPWFIAYAGSRPIWESNMLDRFCVLHFRLTDFSDC